MRIISFIILVVIMGLGIMFASLNASTTQVNYLIGQKELPLIALLFLSLVTGILLGFIAMIWKVLRLKAKVHSLSSKLSKAQEQLSKLEISGKEA